MAKRAPRKKTREQKRPRPRPEPIDVAGGGSIVEESPASPTEIGRAIDPERVHEVFLWITLGATEFQIAQNIAERWPDEDRHLLMAAAFQQIANTGQMDRSLIRGWVIEAAREQYRRAILVNDAAAAIASLRIVTMTARL